MKIISAAVIVTCPGRNFVTLKVVTDQGVYGIGDATLNGRELAVASYARSGRSKTFGNTSTAAPTGGVGR
jgi:L-alanine-DL-glutamate epimerase-like enolase superfamily enzyme